MLSHPSGLALGHRRRGRFMAASFAVSSDRGFLPWTGHYIRGFMPCQDFFRRFLHWFFPIVLPRCTFKLLPHGTSLRTMVYQQSEEEPGWRVLFKSNAPHGDPLEKRQSALDKW